GGVAARLAEVAQARADGAERELLLRELVARIAIAARHHFWIVRVLLAHARLRDLLAFLPAPDVLPIGGIPDGRELGLLDLLGKFLGERLARVLAAGLLHLVLVEAIELRLTLLEERALQRREHLRVGDPGRSGLPNRAAGC